MGFIPINITDIFDILAVALIMYYVYKIARGTPIPSILVGIMLLFIVWFVVRALKMVMLSEILGSVLSVGVIALIVLFQPEIRRFLQMLGNRGLKHRHSFWNRLFFGRATKVEDYEYITPLVRACVDMSASKTGALILIEQHTDLASIADTGIQIDARITASLLKNLFFKNAPLHDGAVIVRGGRIEAAKCILPSTQSNVPVSFGMRHRAALGASEQTDAVVIVVSEETGAISVARNGQIKIGIAAATLKEEIMSHIETGQEHTAGQHVENAAS